jgi:hypothetical protein
VLCVGLSSPQNCLGRYFNIFGSTYWNLVLALLHAVLNILYAVTVCSCNLPYYFFICLYLFRAAPHSSLNHGANCFSRRFGFLYRLTLLSLTTPAFKAYSIKKSSICVALVSLSVSYFFILAVKAAANSTVDECSFHFLAFKL